MITPSHIFYAPFIIILSTSYELFQRVSNGGQGGHPYKKHFNGEEVPAQQHRLGLPEQFSTRLDP